MLLEGSLNGGEMELPGGPDLGSLQDSRRSGDNLLDENGSKGFRFHVGGFSSQSPLAGGTGKLLVQDGQVPVTSFGDFGSVLDGKRSNGDAVAASLETLHTRGVVNLKNKGISLLNKTPLEL